MKDVFDELMGGLDEVEAFLAGQREGFQVHAPENVDVKHIRKTLKMTQEKFSCTFGFSLDAIKNWETGRRKPEAAARTLLSVIHQNPMAVLSAISNYQFEREHSHQHAFLSRKKGLRRSAKTKTVPSAAARI